VAFFFLVAGLFVATQYEIPFKLSISKTFWDRHGSQILKSEAMNIEKSESHHEGWQTLWLAIAG
jgi:hypothetical protein